MEQATIEETFVQAIDRLRDEIAPIKTNLHIEEDLNPKIDFIISKAQELIDLLEAHKDGKLFLWGFLK